MANLILSGLAMVGVLIVVWFGWLRTRRIAFLVLAVWALSVIFGLAWQSFFPLMTQYFGGGAQVRYELLMWIQLLRSFVSSALLIVGLGLLVFGETPRQKSQVR